MFSPAAATSNDTAAVAYTRGGTFTPSLNTTYNPTVCANAPYANAAFGPSSTGLKWRLVSAGIRIKYYGTELNRGGQVVGYSSPYHSDLDGNTIAQLLSHRSVDVHHVADDDGWYMVTWRPKGPDDLVFTSDPPANHAVGTNAPLAIGFSSPDITSINPDYAYECVANYEVIGEEAGPSSTKMTSDPIGTMGVLDWATSELNTMIHGATADTISAALQGVTEAISVYTTTGLPGLTVHAAKEIVSKLPFGHEL
jgi:hypothetical protein